MTPAGCAGGCWPTLGPTSSRSSRPAAIPAAGVGRSPTIAPSRTAAWPGWPVRSTLPQSPSWAGMFGAVGTLVALLARDASGLGQQVDVSAQESMITAIAHAPTFWDLLRQDPLRLGPYLSGRSVTGAAF